MDAPEGIGDDVVGLDPDDTEGKQEEEADGGPPPVEREGCCPVWSRGRSWLSVGVRWVRAVPRGQ